MSKQARSNTMLFITALIWGSSFVAQRAGMDLVGPFTFNGIRTLVGCLVLIPVILMMDRWRQKSADEFSPMKQTEEEKKKEKKVLIVGGIACGAALFVASSLQQIGLVYTTAGKAGFITSLYIVIVPFLGLLLKRKIRPILWLCVALGTVGLYLLSIKEGFKIGIGDLLVMICAFGFATHILVIDYFSPKADGVKMSCLQFLVCGLLSVPFMILFETVNWANILQCWFPILYAGAMSCGIAYTLQVVAQKHTDPTVASLILSLESVLAVIFGVIILNEQVSFREGMGCVVMFAAIILAQIPSKEERQNRNQQISN